MATKRDLVLVEWEWPPWAQWLVSPIEHEADEDEHDGWAPIRRRRTWPAIPKEWMPRRSARLTP